MSPTSLKQLLDTCFIAKHLIETMPELPKGMKPRHIHVLDCIQKIEHQYGFCRISDVSTKLNVTTPSITKLIQELESLDMVIKNNTSDDKRITLLHLTDAGKDCVKYHITDFHTEWLKSLECISDERVLEVIQTIELLSNTMPKKLVSSQFTQIQSRKDKKE